MASTKEEWESVLKDPEFRRQPLDRQVRVANAFFDDRIKSQIPKEEHESNRKSFVDSYFPAKEFSEAKKWDPFRNVPLKQKLAAVDADDNGVFTSLSRAAKANADLVKSVVSPIAKAAYSSALATSGLDFIQNDLIEPLLAAERENIEATRNWIENIAPTRDEAVQDPAKGAYLGPRERIETGFGPGPILGAVTEAASRFGKGVLEYSAGIHPRLAVRALLETIEPYIPVGVKGVEPIRAAEMYLGGKALGFAGRFGLVAMSDVAPRKAMSLILPMGSGTPTAEDILGRAAARYIPEAEARGIRMPPNAVEGFKDFYAKQFVRTAMRWTPAGKMGPWEPSRTPSGGEPRLIGGPGGGDPGGTPQPPPVDTVAIAETVLNAHLEGPDIGSLASRWPRVYSVASGMSDVPGRSAGAWEAFASDVRRQFSLDPDATVTQAFLAEKVKTGEISYLALADLDKTLFDASAEAQGALPGTLVALWDDSQTAAARPAEALVVESAQRRANEDFQAAMDRSLEASQKPPEPTPAVEVPAMAQPEAPAPEAQTRSEFLTAAAEEGRPLSEAMDEHREAALRAQEAGVLSPEVAEEYAVSGDASFDPAALEALEATRYPLTTASPEEWAAAGAGPEDVAALEKQRAIELEESDLQTRREDLLIAGAKAQPGLDFFRKHPIDPVAIERGNYGGEMENARTRGILKKGGFKSIDEAREALAEELGEQASLGSVNDLFDLLNEEARKGTKKKAQRRLELREGQAPYGTSPVSWYYQKLQRTIEQKMGNSATVEQVRALLREQKTEEVEWSGIEEFLAGKAKVGKAELLEFLRGNQIEVKEVLKGDEPEIELPPEMEEAGFTTERYPGKYELWRGDELIESASDAGDFRDQAQRLFERFDAEERRVETKFSSYQIPGGKNYRELLLTLPDTSEAQMLREEAERRGYGDRISEWPDREFAKKYREKVTNARGPEAVFRSSHFNELNILAHVRFNERIGADGERVLFIEEIQSDLHQKGREKGYIRPVPEDLTREVIQYVGEGHPLEQLRRLWEQGFDELGNKFEPYAKTEGKVTNAPFKKTWHELSLKRMVRYAAENGFDKIAWTTGEQQTERYDLSKQVQHIAWEKNDDGTYNLNAPLPNGYPGIYKEDLTLDRVRELVGKDIADKISSGEGETRPKPGYRDWHILSGKDLKVGGHGMVGFYDKVLVDAANKLGKRFGAKVGETEIEVPGYDDRGNENENFKAHSLPIPPVMRESVMREGFSLFQNPTPYILAPSPEIRKERFNKETLEGFDVKSLFSDMLRKRGEVMKNTSEWPQKFIDEFSALGVNHLGDFDKHSSFIDVLKEKGGKVLVDHVMPPSDYEYFGTLRGGAVSEIIYELNGSRKFAYLVPHRFDVDSFGESSYITTRRLSQKELSELIDKEKKWSEERFRGSNERLASIREQYPEGWLVMSTINDEMLKALAVATDLPLEEKHAVMEAFQGWNPSYGNEYPGEVLEIGGGKTSLIEKIAFEIKKATGIDNFPLSFLLQSARFHEFLKYSLSAKGKEIIRNTIKNDLLEGKIPLKLDPGTQGYGESLDLKVIQKYIEDKFGDTLGPDFENRFFSDYFQRAFPTGYIHGLHASGIANKHGIEYGKGNDITSAYTTELRASLNKKDSDLKYWFPKNVDSLGKEKASLESLLERLTRERQDGLSLSQNPTPYILAQPAWHGSPYDFEKFSLQKIGTGEGAQAYGWGLYFAGKKEVAEYYRKVLAKTTTIPGAYEGGSRHIIRGVEFPTGRAGHAALDIAQDIDMYLGYVKGGYQELVDASLGQIEKRIEYEKTRTHASEGVAGEHYRALEDFYWRHVKGISAGDIELHREGRLYKVEIPEDSEYLDWDNPLSGQSEKVKAAVKESVFGFPKKYKVVRDASSLGWFLQNRRTGFMETDFPRFTSKNAAVAFMENPEQATGEKLYSVISTDRGGPEKASAWLASQGIPGIKYAAGQISGAVGGGSNFVIFDERFVSIIDKLAQTHPAYADELRKSGGPDADPRQLALDLAADVRPGQPTIADLLEKQGYAALKNLPVLSFENMEGIIRFIRNPESEILAVAVYRGGKIIETQIFTSGAPAAVSVTDGMIAAWSTRLEELGADKYKLIHNHPSGDPTLSRHDEALAARLKRESGGEFDGLIATDDKEFEVTMGDDKPQRVAYSSSMREFPHRGTEAVWSETAAAAQAVRVAKKGPCNVVLYLDGRGYLIAAVPNGISENMPGLSKQGIASHRATSAIVVQVGGTSWVKAPEAPYPLEVRHAFAIDKDGRITDPGWLRPSMPMQIPPAALGEESAYGPLETTRLAEQPYPYSGRMQAEDFKRIIAERGIKPGQGVKFRVNVGGVKRGKKGRLVAMVPDGLLVLVDVDGVKVETSPDNLVETFTRPSYVEVFRRIEKIQMGKPTAPVKRIIHGQQVGLTEEEIQMTAREALKIRMRSQAYGARMARNASEVEIRHAIEESFQKEKWEQATRRKVVEYVKKFLPLKEQGVFLVRAVEAKTQADLLLAYQEIRQKSDDVRRRYRVGDIKALVSRMMSSPSFPVGFKKLIQGRLNGLRLENWNPETISKIMSDSVLIEEFRDAGDDMVVPSAVLDRINRMANKPLASMPADELDAIYEDLMSIVEAGVNARATAAALDEARRLEALEEITSGPDATKGIHSRMGAEGEYRKPMSPELTWAKRKKNEFLKTLDKFQQLRLVTTPVAMMMELIDGSENGPITRNILNPLQSAFSSFLEELHAVQMNRDQVITRWGDISVEEAERVGVALQAAQEGGREKLYQVGLADADIDAVIKGLTDRHKEMLEYCKVAIEYGTDRLLRVSAEVDNLLVNKIENYFSMLTDWEAMREATDMGQVVAPSGSQYRRNVEKNFLKERVARAKQKIILDPFKVLDIHMPAKLWYIHMAGPLKDANAIVKTDEFKAAAGDIGYPLVAQFLDMMARMGGAEGARRIPWLGRLRRNFSMAQMALNPGTILVQPSSLGDGAAAIGGKYISKGLSLLLDSDFQTMIDDLSPKLKYRGEGRNLYTDVMPGSRLSRMEKYGFAPIQYGDNVSAHAVFGGAYVLYHNIHGLKFNSRVRNEEAADFAQGMVDKTQASPHLIDMPLMVTGGRASGNLDIDQALAQFQLFAMSRSSHVFNDVLGKDWERGDRLKAVTRVSWILGAMAYESGMRLALAAIAGGLAANDIRRQRKDSFLRQMGSQILGLIPIVPSAIQSILYGQDIIPALGVVRRGVTGSRDIVSGSIKGNEAKIARGLVDVLTAILAYKGIPASGVAGRMIKRQIPKDSTKKEPGKI